MLAPRIGLSFGTLALLLCLLTRCAAIRDRHLLDLTTPADTQTSIRYDPTVGPGTEVGLPLDTPPLGRTVKDFEPEGIHLTPYGNGRMLVSWQTGAPLLAPSNSPPKPYDAASVRGVVRYGKHSKLYTDSTAAETALVYEYIYASDAGGNTYESPILHHALLKGLHPGTTYYYIVGSEEHGFSDEYSFKTLTPHASSIRISVFGDLGDTANSSATLKNVIDYKADLVLNMGDFTYADNHLSNQSESDGRPYYVATPGACSGFCYTTDQRRWDGWARLLQPLLSTTPMLSVGGNHETEFQSSNNNWTYTAYNARHPQPTSRDAIVTARNNQKEFLNSSNYNQFINEGGVVQNNSYYVTTAGPVKIFGLHNYLPYGEASQQVEWFKQEINKIDRSKTPWVLAFWHVPSYHTYSTHFRENDAFRAVFEPLLKEAGVDIVMSGHVHAYERSYGVYNYELDECAPVYITIGDGGNIEGLYRSFIDEAPANYCNDSSLYKLPLYQPTPTGKTVISLPDSFNGSFCPQSQPEYSAFREPAFGSGLLEVYNATALRWTWHRTKWPGYPEVVDSVIITKSDNCPNQGSPPPPKPIKCKGKHFPHLAFCHFSFEGAKCACADELHDELDSKAIRQLEKALLHMGGP